MPPAVSLGAFTANGVDMSTVGTKNLTLSDGTNNIEVGFVVTDGYTDGADLTVDVDDLGAVMCSAIPAHRLRSASPSSLARASCPGSTASRLPSIPSTTRLSA